jgi:aminotransferase
MFTPRISARVRAIKISATKEMPMIAAKVGGCVSLGQGVPSFATPSLVAEAVLRELAANPAAGKYSLQPGLLDLRRAVSDLIAREKGFAPDPDSEVAITVGAMEALLCAVCALVDRGDEVLVPEPFYPSHVEQIVMAEGKAVLTPLRRSDWGLDVAALRAAVTPRTRAMLISSPHNPTGAVFAEADLRAAAELAIEKDLAIICDDTYDYLSYDAPAFSLAQIPEVRDRLVGVGSFSKRYALTGWRVGFFYAPAGLMAEMLKVHDCTAICAPTPSQHAALAALHAPESMCLEFKDELRKRRDLACARLDALAPIVSYVRPAGAFYVMARFHLPEGREMSSRELAVRFIHEAKVITVPGDAFGPGGASSLRLSFGAAEEELNEAFDRIEGWVRREFGK